MSYQIMVSLLNLEVNKNRLKIHQVNLTTSLLEAAAIGTPYFHISFNPNTEPSSDVYLNFHEPSDFIKMHRLASDRVLYALSWIFQRPENQDLDFHCALTDAQNHMIITGKEITVFHPVKCRMPFRDRTAAEWKALMLTCWKALMNVGITDLGYVNAVNANPIPVELGLFTPFSSGTLQNVTITAADLAEHHIPLIWSAHIIHTRMAVPGRTPEVEQEYAAHVARERESLSVVLKLSMLDDFWKSRHRNKNAIPKGVLRMKGCAQQLMPLEAKSDADIQQYWARCRAIAESRPPLKRDSVTLSWYSMYREVDIRRGTLTLNPHFKRLRRALECWEGKSATLVGKMTLLKQVVEVDWTERPNKKKKDPRGIHLMKKPATAFHPETASPQQRNAWLLDLQSIARSQKKAPEFVKKKDPLPYEFYGVLSEISDMADLVVDTEVQHVMDQLRPK